MPGYIHTPIGILGPGGLGRSRTYDQAYSGSNPIRLQF
jgi:hypothetical protein